jgi:hypothetical protein
MKGIKQMPLNLPEGSQIMVDAAYTNYHLEQMLANNGILLLAARKNVPKIFTCH